MKQLVAWLNRPQPILRLELLRILLPLAILGFMSSRLFHADIWLGDAGFRVPDLGRADWRQPVYLPPLPGWAAWSMAFTMLASGLSVAIGYRARQAAALFAITLAYAALADRLSAFTVSKLAPILMLTLALSPIGSRYSLDAFLAKRKDPSLARPELCRSALPFFQAFLPVMYFASGVAKMQGDWLDNDLVLFSHLHDSYQTTISWALASTLPVFVWILLQKVVLAFEVLAPLLFAIPQTRALAFIVGLGMHLMIGLMFGPVKWFALLMGSLLVGAYMPKRLLEALQTRLTRLGKPSPELAAMDIR